MVVHMTTEMGEQRKPQSSLQSRVFLVFPLSSLGHRFEESKSHFSMVVEGRAPGNGGNEKERSS